MLEWAKLFFQDDIQIRKIVFRVTLAVIILWIMLGYDSGVGMIERALVNLPLLWSKGLDQYSRTIIDVYGQSFHFSTYVIYGLMYVATSKTLAKLAIWKTKNVLYSILLVMLNAALFEWVYMTLLINFQTGRGLLNWFIGDFMFLSQYLLLLVFGCYGLLLFATEKRWTFRLNWRILAITTACTLTFLTWIYYPFPVATLTYEGWTSSATFPQTHYAYIGSVYAANDLLHTVNVTAKALLALAQIYILKGVKNVGNQH